MSERLTAAQLDELRLLSGERLPRVRNRWHRELSRRALIDRGMIDPLNGWKITEAGRRALTATPDRAQDDRAALQPAGQAGTVEGAGSLVAYLERQWTWSRKTFGPGLRTKGIIQHITKELREIESDPHDLLEWVDVVILAMDGFWRHGGKPSDLLPIMQAKQDKNFARTWPDWRLIGEDSAIEHDRSADPTPPEPKHPHGDDKPEGVR